MIRADVICQFPYCRCERAAKTTDWGVTMVVGVCDESLKVQTFELRERNKGKKQNWDDDEIYS